MGGYEFWVSNLGIKTGMLQLRSCCHCTPVALRRVGTCIQCGCLPATFGRALPQALSFSPEIGSSEVDMTFLG
jgi:hypothetical protein